MRIINRVSKIDSFIYWTYLLIDRFQSGLIALFSGFLLGRVTNELSIPDADWLDVIRGLFSLSNRPTNLLTWLSLIVLIAVPLIHRVISNAYKRRRYEIVFAELVQRHKSPSIAPFKGIGWEGNLTLQSCPILHRGWLISEVQIRHNTTRYSIPHEYNQAYEEYFKKHFSEKRFFDDGIKVMLRKNPIAFSDSPTLILETQEALYSQIQFYHENVAILDSKRREYIRKAVEELCIDFPHSLCMHVIVVTRDDKVLLTKRSSKVAYFPGTWSCSIEEQLSLQDLKDDPESPAQRWFERLLKEELGLGMEMYNKENLRVLSVFLESDILSVSLCGHVVIDLNSKELGKVLENLPRVDYEFSEWDFLSHEELLAELFHPNRQYHPTSRYRMFMALIKKFGEPRIAEMLFSQEQG
ncbi:MAG: hypothetical protein QXZ09_09220 [Candidatus Methanomethylicaceae archaeon]